MTLHQPDLTVRPIAGRDELGLFNRLPYVLNDELSGDLAAGRRRPEWLWIAQRADRVVGRAGWWSRPGDRHPLLMDIFDITDDVEDGVRLLQTALPAVTPAGATPPEYGRFLPPDWRDHAGTRQAVEERMSALERVGARRAAETQYHDELARYPSPQEWWRVATLPDGEPVGFVIPAHNGYHPIIAYLGVVPAHRGHGHIHDVLAAGTRLLAARDVPRIRAATDVGNAPMAAAFAAAGYATFHRQIDMTWR